jgi:hypothetical protein
MLWQPVWRQGDLAMISRKAALRAELTVRTGAIRLHGGSISSNGRQRMDQRQVDTTAFVIGVTCFTAPMAAAMLGYNAHYNFGLSRQEIRTPAVVGAIIIAVVIGTLMAIDFFCRRLRKP